MPYSYQVYKCLLFHLSNPISKLVPLVSDWRPESDEDKERLRRMFCLSAAALKVRDREAASARNAEQVGVPDCLTDKMYLYWRVLILCA